MQIIDNINKTVKEDLQESIRRGSKMSVELRHVSPCTLIRS